MIINLLAGGPVSLLPNLDIYKQEGDIWIGVDRGVLTLFSIGIQPSIAFGDFDSVSAEEMAVIEEQIVDLKRFRPEKDETDMELALNWAIKQKPKLIRIFGATGGRLDHFFANIQLLVNPFLHGEDAQIEIIDHSNIIYIKGPGIHEIKRNLLFKYVSFIPLSMEIHDLTLNGFKYPLQDEHIQMGSTLCISNELINDSGNFSFSKGIIMVVRSKD
ncbi:thiamine diphosphokinase [Bacillus sp. DTU_2020_1000418_1_SI_GHA_SEK_038]|uniref:thiamine diphosphokinase n=1 Tax=Bacillus sp. DTU_2020_1000418_1_SI_GHA_SEK_038 TaxID=3077585 RepID=UPI0028EC0509|nr:thiamine diphosphokinase [Bacillus sp. DTU_2020_1000418_1_SI_GHA_SEK_038]WNS77127.1 thiamine diphosphokinase [Bacillus sp. DTU_2020_1000418_1_SI_GHA_SEK_038]